MVFISHLVCSLFSKIYLKVVKVSQKGLVQKGFKAIISDASELDFHEPSRAELAVFFK